MKSKILLLLLIIGSTSSLTFSQLKPVSNYSCSSLSATGDSTAFALVGHDPFDFHTLIKTSDAGQNWEEVIKMDSGYSARIQFINSNNGFISILKGSVYFLLTTDAGKSWELKSDSTNLLDFQFVNDSVGYANSGKSLIKTINKGQNWSVIKNFDEHFAFDFLNENVGVIYSSQLNNDKIYITIDGGKTWAKRNGVSSVKKIKIISEYELLLLTELVEANPNWSSLFKSNDAGLTWNLILENACPNTNHPIENGFLTDFDLVSPNVYVAACSTKNGHNLIYTSIDSGENWSGNLDSSVVINDPHITALPSGNSWIFSETKNIAYNFIGEETQQEPTIPVSDSTATNQKPAVDEETPVLSSFPNQSVLYPNPADGYIEISNVQQDQMIKIYNSAGRLIETTNSSKILIDHYKSGTYFLTSSDGKIRKKFIKR